MKSIFLVIFIVTNIMTFSFAHDDSKKHAHDENGDIIWLDQNNQRVPDNDRNLAADVPPDGQYTSPGQNRTSGFSSFGGKLSDVLEKGRSQFDEVKKAYMKLPETPSDQKAAAKEVVVSKANEISALSNYVRARNFEIAAKANGGDLDSGFDQAISQDRRIQCRKIGDFTLDWRSCKSGLDAYNMIVIADAALDLSQKVRTQQQTQQLSQQVAARSAQGDAQNAALDASIQSNNSLSGMNQEKAAAYMAAVGLLGTKIAGWQGKSKGAFEKLCQANGVDATLPITDLISDPNARNKLPRAQSCSDSIDKIKGAEEVFANESGKAALVAAFMQYMQKAAAAGMAAKQLSNIAKKVEQVKQGTETNEPTTFDRCVVAPNDPACQTPGSRTPAQQYAGGDFSVDGLGSNMIGGTPLEDTEIKTPDPSELPTTVGDASSPFADKAKDADGILNPAPAASLGSGAPGTQSGAMGGMGGSRGGAGGATLGNDLKGPETPKQNEVKANQVGAAYKFAGGQGFKAVAASKDDNPFSSLFDSKSQGGLEEDRSIASDDIGGKDSGLFMRISKRYGKVQSDKRIEALNLE